MYRRALIKGLAVTGIGSAVFHRALAAEVEKNGGLAAEALREAEWISGIALSEEERATLVPRIDRLTRQLAGLRKFEISEGTPPALHFFVGAAAAPIAGGGGATVVAPTESAAPRLPEDNDALAFLPVSELAALVRTRQVTAVALTRLYLDRLKRFDEKLRCVVTLTEERALEQAARADAEIAAGRYRGPLHGIPWGAKDLMAYPGYPTTWGAPQFRDRVLAQRATVARRLDEAGAVLVAKLSLGALAMGDRWYGGPTRDPWNPTQGSSGSSAGSAAATAAGLVGFALGSETLGSIVSPSRRCGATGLRPTFGRVSRYGCMALSWSMDKIGPITRSVEDAALVFGAIQGADGLDPTAVDAPFSWPGRRAPESISVGYVDGEHDEAVDRLRRLGFQLVEVELPDRFPVWDMIVILTAEAATAFHEFTRDGITDGLNTWPEEFRRGHFIPAVDYLRAQRMRTELMQEMGSLFEDVDVIVGGGRDELAINNLTGNPSVVMPWGMKENEGVRSPGSITMTGRCFGETALLQVARAFQESGGDSLGRPPGF